MSATRGLGIVVILLSTAWLPPTSSSSSVEELVCPDEAIRTENPLPTWGGGGYPYVYGCLAIGLRPGAMIFSQANEGCTMNFIFTDGTDYYFGTAGHCVNGLRFPVEVYGEGVVGTSVYRIYTDDLDPLDFALVRIDPAKRDRVEPAVAFWGGPTGLATGPAESAEALSLKLYGNGLGLYASHQTRARAGALTDWKHNTVAYNIPTLNGDSGAPVMTADGLAVASHKGFGLPSGLMRGFQIVRGIQLAEAALGVDLELVTAPLTGDVRVDP